MKPLLILMTILTLTTGALAQQGQLIGKVTDSKTGEELVGAAIVVDGTTQGTITDFSGDYILTGLEPGTYTFRCQFISYQPGLKQNITITAGQSTTVNFELLSAEIDLQEVQVVAKAKRESDNMLLMEQKTAVKFSEAIGAQQLSTQGVSDAATAATKMTGITKQQGSKTLNIRGLGDRYNATTLNGLPLPSNHAEYKNIDLELFSTDVIEYVAVEKVYSPNLSGDFAGANINVVSKKFSGDPYLEVGVKTGANTNAMNEDPFYTSDGVGYWGFDNFEQPTSLSRYSFDRNWNPKNTNGAPNTGFSLAGGRTLKAGKTDINLFATASFDNEMSASDLIQRKVNGSNNIRQDLTGNQYDIATQSTGMLNVNLNRGRNNYYLNSLFLNSSTQSVTNLRGFILDLAENGAYVSRQEYERTTMWVNQMLGEQNLSKSLQLNWGIAMNNVSNIIPDRLHYTLDGEDENIKSFTTNDIANTNRYYHELTEDEIAGNLSLDFKFGNSLNQGDYRGKLSVGATAKQKERDFIATQFNHKINSNASILVTDVDSYLNETNRAAGNFDLRTLSTAIISSTYTGEQQIIGGFAAAEYQLTRKLSTLMGVRYEQVYQKITYNTTLSKGSNDFIESNLLPALTLKYTLTDKSNLRLAAGNTYTLPQFKESAPFLFEGITDATVGNPYLKPSKDFNAEIKWEHFPNPGELVSLALFGKYIQDPINKFVKASASNDFTYANTGDQAEIAGIEIELKKELFNHATPGGSRKLSLATNATLMHTSQSLDKNKILKETKNTVSVNFNKESEVLQGASPIIGNANLSYRQSWKDDQRTFTTSLVYGYVSESLALIGYSGLGNQVDQSLQTLDLIIKSSFNKLDLSLAAKNLLNPDVEKIQENSTQNFLVKSGSKGIKLSLSLSYTF
ncbi:TonB-dependent receptor [Breznakibacter xylanolyticus]|uniref:TonB-dependent receptor n=1 Tax=Breznakibacter xylanolyticus TaxID=990 RepID=A0A2W7NDE2_9BACT|nr:TonB-dependent receptor [Breznakibacter xylanolyticus]PZX18168.1 TonB-dependent receptor [Breznakibacter xylanolyticus]